MSKLSPTVSVLRAHGKNPDATTPTLSVRELDAAYANLEARSLRARRPLTRAEAAVIAQQWHSVTTWNDPGDVMYSLGSTGRVHSAEHREALLKYIDDHCLNAKRATRRDLTELKELRAWIEAQQRH